ncbi:MAG: NAD-dependent epimerase/dehydratase family protein [Roseburia sp.]
MRILIAGAGGFVGNFLCQYLKNKGHEIIAIYRKTMPKGENIKAYQIDLKNHFELKEDVDVIINFASQMRGDKIIDYLDNTVLPMRNLLEFAEKKHIKTFIGISSIAIYGEVDGCVDENSDRVNTDDYGTAKYIVERLLEDADIDNKYILRLPRILGPGVDFTYPWIPQMTMQLIKNENVYYFNPELLYNNLMHVENFAQFVLLLLNREKKGYEIIVLGSKTPMPVFQVINILKREIGSSSRLLQKEYKGKNSCHWIDISKAISIGYKPMETEDVLKLFAREALKDLER